MIKPMLAELQAVPLNDKAFIWETKYDGVRAIIDTKTGIIWSRSGKDKTAQFPEIKPKTKLPAILDGEIVVWKNGKSDFNSIQHRGTASNADWRAKEFPASFECFDVLEVNGNNLMHQPLRARKQILKLTLEESENCHIAQWCDDGEQLFRDAVSNGLEGVIGKKLDSFYVPDNRGLWVKVKANQMDTFTVVGYTQGTGWRVNTFGALVLAKDGKFVGECGTGFNDRQIDELFTAMQLLRQGEPAVQANGIPLPKATWLVPALRVLVRFLEYSNAGMLRFPAFKGVV